MELEICGSDDFETAPFHENDIEAEQDLPPEFCHYRDEGCELADSCLNCPLPGCIYDEPGGRQRWQKRIRNREISRTFRKGGVGVRELASRFGVSERTIQRVLKETAEK